jgi:hypothetical protein
MNKDLKNLASVRFMMGFHAELGIPQTSLPLPGIVSLGSDTLAVVFNTLYSTFQVVELKLTGDSAPTYHHP